MAGSYTIGQLVEQVENWCQQHQIASLRRRPAPMTIRNVRYYQGLGLVDPPVSANGRGFTELHQLQLRAIRLLQSRGLPLAQIEQRLKGRTEDELRQMLEAGIAGGEVAPVRPGADVRPWKALEVTPDILVLVRGGTMNSLTSGQREAIQRVLNLAPSATAEEEETGFRPEFD